MFACDGSRSWRMFGGPGGADDMTQLGRELAYAVMALVSTAPASALYIAEDDRKRVC